MQAPQEKQQQAGPAIRQHNHATNPPVREKQEPQGEQAPDGPQAEAYPGFSEMVAGSAQVRSLSAFGEMVSNSPQAKALAGFSAMVSNSPQVTQMRAFGDAIAQGRQPNKEAEEMPLQRKPNNTGLPDQLKSGIESLSGMSMDDVKVHYNSAKPAGLQAHAYAQGTDIHVAPGQEEHLPHEAWHIVQQKQGRVRPTLQMKGDVPVNDDTHLEKEADVMGAKAVQTKSAPVKQLKYAKGKPVLQRNPDEDEDSDDEKREKRKEKAFKKLEGVNKRNKRRKAFPKRHRNIFEAQYKLNYGYPRKKLYGKDSTVKSDALMEYNPKLNQKINPAYEQMDIDGMSGYFRQGFGRQPFLYLDKQQYEGKMIKSNYDDIISFFKGKDAEIALQILSIIESGAEVDKKSELGQAVSLFTLLTQFSEAHNTRIPGSDKYARALLRRIALGQLTFKEAFNRKDGLYVSAWAKKGGAKVGGQEAARTLFGAPHEGDKYTREKMEQDLNEKWFDELFTTTEDYFSDSSDEEKEEDEYHYSKKTFSGIWDRNKVKHDKQLLEKVNESMKALELPVLPTINDLKLVLHKFETVKGAYRSLARKYHRDKSGEQNDEKFNSISEAYNYLSSIKIEFTQNTFIDSTERVLQENVQNAGFQLHLIAGNGNCFYDAILDQLAYLNGFKGNPDLIRNRIAQLIIDNQDHFEVYVAGATLNTIVDQILTSHSWNNQAGDFAPQLIATVLNRSVNIISPSGTTTIPPIPNLILNNNNTLPIPGGPLNIVYNGYNHYNSTRRPFLR